MGRLKSSVKSLTSKLKGKGKKDKRSKKSGKLKNAAKSVIGALSSRIPGVSEAKAAISGYKSGGAGITGKRRRSTVPKSVRRWFAKSLRREKAIKKASRYFVRKAKRAGVVSARSSSPPRSYAVRRMRRY